MMAGRELLTEAIEAHGGLARWQSASEVVARVTGYAFWNYSLDVLGVPMR
jgi:hypothetical protein